MTDTAAENLLNNDPASQMLGIKIDLLAQSFCQLSMRVRSEMTNGYGYCHGGFIFTLADTACAFAAADQGFDILTANNQIEYLMPACVGSYLFAEAKISIISGKNRYCDVKVRDQDQNLIAIARSKLIAKASSE